MIRLAICECQAPSKLKPPLRAYRHIVHSQCIHARIGFPGEISFFSQFFPTVYYRSRRYHHSFALIEQEF